ncbi:MAG: hypothetical protein AAB213_03095 [Candidatus Omnitrophota bacterium]
MKGRIVEKNEQLLVLKSGEGEEATKTTIYLEDINRIESDEEYSNETKFFPTALPRVSVSRPWDVQAVLIEPAPMQLNVNTDQTEYIKGIIKRSDRTLPESGAAGILSAFNAASMGDGSISGSVKLPEQVSKHKAPLYVYLAKDAGGSFVIAPGLPYQKIEPDSLTSSLIYYKIEHLGAGHYKVFADWDIAPPLIGKKKINDVEILIGFGTKGDYAGAYEDIVKLDADENRDNVNIDCQTYVTKDFVDVSDVPKSTDFSVIDIYFKKISSKQMILALRVKNTGETAITSLALDAFINDEKVGQEPYVLGGLALKEDKEFDITSLMGAGAYHKPFSMLRFKFVRPKTGEVELEKDVYLPVSNTNKVE